MHPLLLISVACLLPTLAATASAVPGPTGESLSCEPMPPPPDVGLGLVQRCREQLLSCEPMPPPPEPLASAIHRAEEAMKGTPAEDSHVLEVVRWLAAKWTDRIRCFGAGGADFVAATGNAAWDAAVHPHLVCWWDGGAGQSWLIYDTLWPDNVLPRTDKPLPAITPPPCT